jgi:hypothetical protein
MKVLAPYCIAVLCVASSRLTCLGAYRPGNQEPALGAALLSKQESSLSGQIPKSLPPKVDRVAKGRSMKARALSCLDDAR